MSTVAVQAGEGGRANKVAGAVVGVVIGRNEGERLSRVLRAAMGQIDTVVYVDSGSVDGSAERARGAGAHVVELRSGPFTAARGRQAGMTEALRLRPDAAYVQFIDGDCVLEPGWVEAALAAIGSDPGLAAVCGLVREEHAATNFFSRLADVDWNGDPGPAEYCGGNALMRIAAVAEAGGWSADLIAGEEPDLCFRMRDRGWRIERLGVPMVVHDIGMHRFRAYWRRCTRTGHAFAEVGWRRRSGCGRVWLRRAASNVLYGLAGPVAVGVCGALSWPVGLALTLPYARLLLAGARRCRRRGGSRRFAAAYGAVQVVCKPAGALGALRFVALRLTGAGPRLIEYKPAQRVAPAPELLAAAREGAPD